MHLIDVNTSMLCFIFAFQSSVYIVLLCTPTCICFEELAGNDYLFFFFLELFNLKHWFFFISQSVILVDD